MISAVSSNSAAATANAGGRAAKIEALSKQASKLRQEETHAKTSGSNAEPAASATSRDQEIVSIQAQIERLMLETQLSKLTESVGTSHSKAELGGNTEHAGAAQKLKSDGSHGTKSPDPYNVANEVGRVVNEIV